MARKRRRSHFVVRPRRPLPEGTAIARRSDYLFPGPPLEEPRSGNGPESTHFRHSKKRKADVWNKKRRSGFRCAVSFTAGLHPPRPTTRHVGGGEAPACARVWLQLYAHAVRRQAQTVPYLERNNSSSVPGSRSQKAQALRGLPTISSPSRSSQTTCNAINRPWKLAQVKQRSRACSRDGWTQGEVNEGFMVYRLPSTPR